MKENFLLKACAPSLRGKNIVLGITGSIAAFKAVDLLRALKKCGANVKVILTAGGEKFVTPLTLETLSGEKVLTSLWGQNEKGVQGTHHISTARWADLFVIMPASANTVARLANGLADDLLATECLVFRGPLLIVPAMNQDMWAHPATQANAQKLREYGYQLIGPTSGETACGEEGEGRMLEAEEVLQCVAKALFKAQGATPRKILVTLGGTQSSMDPVRALVNRSSGKMGAALVWEAARRGYQVTALVGRTSDEVSLPPGVEVVATPENQTLERELHARWGQSDVLIGAAAVLDFQFLETSSQKKKKEAVAGAEFNVTLSQTPDLLAWAGGEKKPHQRILGFAAETENALPNARKKLESKKCDAVFVNDVSRADIGFDSDSNEGTWVSRSEEKVFKKGTKFEIASGIMDRIEGLW